MWTRQTEKNSYSIFVIEFHDEAERSKGKGLAGLEDVLQCSFFTWLYDCIVVPRCELEIKKNIQDYHYLNKSLKALDTIGNYSK